MITQDDLNKAYEDLSEAKGEYITASTHLETLKATIETRTATALYHGEIEGKNDAQRKGAAMEMFSQDYEELAQLQHNYANAKYHYEVAQIEVDRVRSLLRLMEITK
jgi:hypothetical protein